MIGFFAKLVVKGIKWLIVISAILVVISWLLAAFSPMSTGLRLTLSEGTEAPVYEVRRQHNKVMVCATGGLAMEWVKNHFETTWVEQKLCGFQESEGTKLVIDFPIFGERSFELPQAGRAYVIHLPFTNERIEIASGDFTVHRLVDLETKKGGTLKLIAIEVVNHQQFLELTPGVKITDLIADPTKGSEDSVSLLVSYRVVQSATSPGSLEISLPED